MDEIDQKIIEMLLKNSRTSFVDMSKELGLSRVAVRERVKALEEKGIIEEFTILLNQEKIGKPISVFLNIDVETLYLESIANTLAENPDIVSTYQMTGPSTLHVHAVLPSVEALEKLLYQQLYPIKGIKTVESQILLRRFKSRGGIRP